MDRLEFAKDLLGRGLLKEALVSLADLKQLHPTLWEAHLLAGITLGRLGKPEEAVLELERALKISPDSYETLLCLSKVQRSLGQIDLALQSSSRAVELQPDRWEARESLADLLSLKGSDEDACLEYEIATQLEPNLVPLRLKLGQCYQHLRKSREAEQELRLAFQLDSESPKTCLALSAHYSRYGILGKSLDVLKIGLAKSPQNAALHVAAASAFTLIRNDSAAEQHYERAVKFSRQARIPYALWLIGQGRNEEALTLYQEIRRDSPRAGVAYYGIVQTHKGAASDEKLLVEMKNLLEDSSLDSASRMYLCYGLAKIWEQRGGFEMAMSYFDQANAAAFEIQSASMEFNLKRIEDDFKRVTACYEELVRQSVWGTKGPSPIFIVGMIRSGTTLLDQIISSHSQVENAGELRFWIEKSLWLSHLDPSPDHRVLGEVAYEYLEYGNLLTGREGRFTDKMPLNYSYLGLIHRALPNARFVHIRRHPVDTCLSIYTTYFGTGAEFYHNKANTAAYYRQYQDAMDYWKPRIPEDRLLEIRYEDLIAEPEATIQKVIKFCDLPWDEACLHHEKNSSAISTPSRWQARQPMYKTSLDRWRNYGPWLGEFAELIPGSGSGS